MCLLREIAGVLGCNQELITSAFDGYVMDDFCTTQPAPRTILLLESPHVDEVSAGHPLAGLSGRFVTEALRRNVPIRTELDRLVRGNPNLNGSEAIGRILQCCPQTLRLGLMNSSRLPLQIKAHCDDNWRLHGEFLCFLELVKYRPKLLSIEPTNRPSRIFRVLLNDLKSRLERLPEDALIVACGKVARAFIAGAINLEGYRGVAQIHGRKVGHWNKNRKVPHPSYGHWNNNRKVTSLVDIIRERAGLYPIVA